MTSPIVGYRLQISRRHGNVLTRFDLACLKGNWCSIACRDILAIPQSPADATSRMHTSTDWWLVPSIASLKVLRSSSGCESLSASRSSSLF